MKARNLLTTAIVAATVLVGGCRNPFNPSAIIRFDRFFAGDFRSYVLTIPQTSAGTMRNAIGNLSVLRTEAQFANSSTVRGTITGYNVVYRQLSNGLPITACGGAAGRRFSTLIQLNELSSNYSSSEPSSGLIQIVTDELLTHIATTLTTVEGGIDCEVTFYGEDDNGYDIQLDAVLHIDVL